VQHFYRQLHFVICWSSENAVYPSVLMNIVTCALNWWVKQKRSIHIVNVDIQTEACNSNFVVLYLAG
jgi:hypothetical protein